MSIKSYILTLWETSHGYRLRIVGSSMAGVAQVCASLMFIWSSKRLVDLATGAAGSSGATGNTGSSDSSLPLFLGAMIAFMLLQLLFGAISSRLDSLNNVRMDNGLRHDLFGRLMHSTWSGKECYHTGDLINRMEEDTRSVTHTLCSRIPAMVSTLFQGVAAFGFLWMLDARLAWILLLVMPLALGLGKPYMRRMRNLTHTIRTLESQIQGHLQEHLQHRILLRTLEGVGRSLDALAGLQTTLQRATMRRADFALSSRIAIQVGFAAGYIIAFLWGIFGLQSGAVTFGMMTAFLQLVSQVQRPVVDLSRQIPALAQTFTAVERLSELTALPQEPTGRPIPCQGRLGIRLREVEFTYPESHRRVIHAFTHDFRPGTMTALVGETGAGKSTLLRLMLGLLRPDEGEVELYNETTAVRVSSLTYGNMVYVPQGNTLMSGTLRDNLLLGNPHATPQQMEWVLTTAAADFVFTLPQGLETLCGEQGAGLSEGQAQRIAIARGLLRPGALLLLDEPTSALDPETEQLLLQRLCSLRGTKTLIVVTHKESIAQRCDASVHLENTQQLSIKL